VTTTAAPTLPWGSHYHYYYYYYNHYFYHRLQ
jgi:hypothetical protein